MMASESSAGWSRHRFTLGILCILALALWLRIAGLDAKPLHSDEGVNGWFTLRLWWWNVYRYQFSDYHGPFLYYVNLVMFWLLGASEVSLRLGTALTGAAVPLLLVPFRRHMGVPGVLLGALLLAVAPCNVYFSRTVIHEIYLVFFTLVWALALVRFAATPSLRWGLLAALGAFGAFANKETAILTLGSLGAGFALAWALGRSPDGGAEDGDVDLFGGRSRWPVIRDVLLRSWKTFLLGGLLFGVLLVLFFSSFFSYWPGVEGFFKAFTPWIDYGVTGRNQAKEWTYFWELMRVWSEGPTLWFALAAALWSCFSRHRFGLLLTGWAVASFAAYSAISYKTPWCVLNIDLPMALLAAWGVGQAIRFASDFGRPPLFRAAALLYPLGLVVACVPLLLQTLDVNSDRYDDAEVPYVYVQTTDGFLDMVADLIAVGQVAAEDGRGPRVLNVDAKNPVRWYTIVRGWAHDRSRYLKKVPSVRQLARSQIVVVSGKRVGSVRRLVEQDASDWHREVYDNRPGWTTTVWYRQALWEAYQQAGGGWRGQLPLIEGLSNDHRELLIRYGFRTIEDVADSEIEDLCETLAITEEQSQLILDQANDVLTERLREQILPTSDIYRPRKPKRYLTERDKARLEAADSL